MNFNDICGEEHAKRAAEIALSGHHFIHFVGSHQSQARDLAKLVNIQEGGSSTLSLAIAPCPCGFYGDPQVVCNCTLEDIYRWRVEMFPWVPDMMIEVPNPMLEKILAWAQNDFQDGEPHEDIVARVNHARAIYYHISQTDESAWTLLKAAMSHMALTPLVVKNTCAVANTIAILGNSGTVRTQHMAEAIQYAPRGLYRRQI